MKGYVEQCVVRYLELAQKPAICLKKVATPYIDDHHLTDEDINVKEVRLVKEDGEQMGVVDIETAMKAARDENLDLVELVPEAKPPVCKIMDYKHFLYDQKQKAKEAKKNQKQTQLNQT